MPLNLPEHVRMGVLSNGMVTNGRGGQVLRACPDCQAHRRPTTHEDLFGLYCPSCDRFTRLEDYPGQRADLLERLASKGDMSK